MEWCLSMNDRPAPGARLDLEGALNVRDLGGWATEQGGTLARGIVYRSDKLSALTPKDHRLLEGLGIRKVIDLRYDSELEADPSRLWDTVEHHLHLPIAGEIAQLKSFIDRVLDGEYEELTAEWIGDSYVEMLQRYPDQFAQAAIGAVDGSPTLFHCTAGKDRTGLVAMLLLSTAGVGEHDILFDFTLTNVYRTEHRIESLTPKFVERGLDIERFRPALSAPQPAMEQAMAWLRANFGSPAGYLEELGGLGAEGVDRIRTALLEPPG